MQSKWQVKDLIDLEHFLNQAAVDPSAPESADAASSDRRLYLAYEKTHRPPYARRELIKYWLDENRKIREKTASGDGKLAGDTYSEAVHLVRSILIIVSLVSGAGLAWSVLSYSGTAPINIFTCIWVFIIPQFLLIAILGISMIFSRLKLPHPFQGAYPLLSALIRRLARRAKQTGESPLPADQRNRIYAMAGLIGRQKTLYGPVFFWPVFILAQTFGVCFNLGLIIATVLKLAITDLAFGWQSTLLPDPETVYRMVDVFALPWSWIPSAHPTLDQIHGSRIILKDGMLHLATQDLVSWWPFLCLSIVFYGLMPRILLLATGYWQQNLALGRVSFSTSACDRLIQRMRTPQVQSAGRAYASSRTEDISPQNPAAAARLSKITPAAAADPALIFIPEDIDKHCHDEDLKERINHILGLRIIRRIKMDMDPATDMAALEAVLSGSGVSLKETRLVILTEAWQPPIRETVSWLNRLRDTVAKDTGIIIALIGKPANQLIFTSPDDADRVIWEQAVNRLGDPFLRVENLGGC